MTDTQPSGLDDADVFVRADAPDSYGRWYIRADDTVVYQWPNGKWNEHPLVSAVTLRTSHLWTQVTL